MASFLSSIFGSTPNVPAWKPISLGTMQQQATQNNLAALPGAEAQTGAANAFSIAQLNQMFASATPGIAGINTQIGKNLSSEVAGEVPADVAAAIGRSGAASALGLGVAGTTMQGDMTARQLGLTSLNLEQAGTTSAENWEKGAASIYEPQMTNVTSMFVNPMQEYQAANQQEEEQWSAQMLQNQMSAAPDPVASGIFNIGTNLINAVRGGQGQTTNQQWASGAGGVEGPSSGGSGLAGLGSIEGPGQGTGEGTFDMSGIPMMGGL